MTLPLGEIMLAKEASSSGVPRTVRLQPKPAFALPESSIIFMASKRMSFGSAPELLKVTLAWVRAVLSI